MKDTEDIYKRYIDNELQKHTEGLKGWKEEEETASEAKCGYGIRYTLLWLRHEP